MTTEITILPYKNELRVDSRLLAKNLDILHSSLIQLIDKHLIRLKKFGKLIFQKRATKKGHLVRFALLNEQQATALLTLCRNSERSVDLKMRLVEAFFEMRKKYEELYTVERIVNRTLACDYYPLLTSAVQQHLIKPSMFPTEKRKIFSSYADILNKIVFGLTAEQWREAKPELADQRLNIRDDIDFADELNLRVLAALELLESELIEDGFEYEEIYERLEHAHAKYLSKFKKTKSITERVEDKIKKTQKVQHKLIRSKM